MTTPTPPEQPWVRVQYDRRQTCECGHRYGVHATGGTQCLAVVDDPDQTSLRPCRCQRWNPPQPQLRKTL